MYMAIKHSHMLLVALSLAFLVLRFVLSLTGSALLQRKFFKVAPHIIDTFLLLSAVALMVTIQQYPFVNPWLTEKLLAVLAYIALGVMAFRGRTTTLRVFAFVGALGWLVLAIKLAMTKTPVLFG